MTSINTNISAMVALQTLADVNSQLTETNNRVSTGLRIAQAQDSAAYWAIATTTRSDNGALGTVRDAIAIGKATLDVMYNGLESVRESLQEVKELFVAARQPGVDRMAIQEQVDGLIADMQNKAGAAVLNEQNFLSVSIGATATRSIVASFERTEAGIAVSTIDINLDEVKLIDEADQSGFLDSDYTGTSGDGTVNVTDDLFDFTSGGGQSMGALTDSAADMNTLEAMIDIVDQALTSVIGAQNLVGVNQSRAESQDNFISTLMDANDRAVGALVDANMEQESSRLRALQTQQQLAVQSLSIANASANNVLALFR